MATRLVAATLPAETMAPAAVVQRPTFVAKALASI
jgi:hypothetical protein